jgi:hypothetical protein
MPTSKQTCQKPKELKDKPSQCSPAQVKKCHGAATAHPCAPTHRVTSKQRS